MRREDADGGRRNQWSRWKKGEGMGGRNGNKTQATRASVEDFLARQDESTRADCRALILLMAEATGEVPVMWGTGMVGFGTHHYRYASGREGDIFQVGFAPRKAALSIYLTCDIGSMGDLLARLGRHDHGKGCLYVKRLADIDLGVLKQMVVRAVGQNG